MILRAFIEAMRMESMGFAFGNPWRHNDLSVTCVLPILRNNGQNRSYVTSQEAKKDVEIIDTGRINEIEIKNNGSKPVFFRIGEMIEGKTQERALTLSRLIFPGENQHINVKCIHASRPISPGSKFTSTYRYAPSGRDVMYMRGSLTKSWNQGESWNQDQLYYTSSLGAPCLDTDPQDPCWTAEIRTTPPDDLVKVSEKVEGALKEVIKKCPYHDNQIGVSLIDTKGFHSLDSFDLSLSWRAIKEAIVGKESLKIAEQDEPGVFEYKPERAKELTKNVLAKGFEEEIVFQDEKTRTLALRYGENYIGEAVLDLSNGEEMLVHLLIAREHE